jgi:hypothetical protein
MDIKGIESFHRDDESLCSVTTGTLFKLLIECQLKPLDKCRVWPQSQSERIFAVNKSFGDRTPIFQCEKTILLCLIEVCMLMHVDFKGFC